MLKYNPASKNSTAVRLLFAVLSLGAYTLAAQTLFIRQFLVTFAGNELCISAVLSTWLAGIAAGALLSSRVLRKKHYGVSTFLFLLGTITVLCPVQIQSVQILRGFLNISAGQPASLVQILLSALLTTLPTSFATGFSFALACSILPATYRNAGTIGTVYIAEAAGSTLAGLLFTFLLIPHFTPLYIVAIMNTWLLISITILGLSNRSRRMQVLTVAGILTLLMIIWNSGCITNIEDKGTISRLRTQGMPVAGEKKQDSTPWHFVKSFNSRYQNITLIRLADQYTVLENDRVSFVFPDEVEHEHLAHFVMVQHPAPRKVLIIGSGTGGLLRQILKHPVDEMDYVELDPAIIDAVKPYLPAPDKNALADPRITVHYIDGRRFVKLTDKQYDLILLNTPEPMTLSLNRFYTLEFFLELKNIMAPGAVLSLPIPSTVHLAEDVASYSGSIDATLQQAFPKILVTAGPVNMFFASDRIAATTFDPEILRQRFEERNIETSYFSPYYYEATDSIWPEKVKFTRERLHAGNRFLNTDNRPITYYLNMILWSHYSGSGISDVFRKIQSLSWTYVAGLLLIAALILMLWSTIKNRHRKEKNIRLNSLFVITTTGFAGMALGIILMFSFQSICGYVYEKVALFIASFMGGLLAGALLSKNRIARRKANPTVQIIVLELLLLLMAIATGFLIPSIAAADPEHLPYPIMETVFYLMMASTGILVGAEFPLSNHMFINSGGGKTTISAALTDTGDHTGAFIGAFLTGIVFLPLFGSSSSCLLVAAAKLSAILLLLGQIISKKLNKKF